MDTHNRPANRERRQLFSELMREHHRELLVFAGAATGNRDDARDIVQEAFVSAWKNFDRFDPDREFGAWMRGIVRNKVRDWFRARRRDPIVDFGLAEMEADLSAWQQSREAGEAIFEVVEGCIGKLPGNFKHAVQAFYFEDRQGDEAAASLDISPSNLRKRLQRARALLYDCISRHLQPQPEKSHV